MDIKKYVHFQKKTINNRPPTFYTFIYDVNNMKLKLFIQLVFTSRAKNIKCAIITT